MSGVAGGHHVLGVEHLLCQLGYRQCAVLLAATRRQRSEAGHEEVEAREGNHVNSQLTQIGVQLHATRRQHIVHQYTATPRLLTYFMVYNIES